MTQKWNRWHQHNLLYAIDIKVENLLSSKFGKTVFINNFGHLNFLDNEKISDVKIVLEGIFKS